MKTNTKQLELSTQHSIPRSCAYLSYDYSNVNWNQACRLYSFAVDIVLHKQNVDVLSEIPWGRGHADVKKLFENYLAITEDYNKKSEIEEEEEEEDAYDSL